MSALLSPNPVLRFYGSDGQPLSGGYLQTLDSETSNPVATYRDAGMTTENPSTIMLDANGEPSDNGVPVGVFLVPDAVYKFKWFDSDMSLVGSSDGIVAGGGSGSGTGLVEVIGTAEHINVTHSVVRGVSVYRVDLAPSLVSEIDSLKNSLVQFGDEVDALEGIVASKADKVQSATAGNFASLDSNGNLTDSGSKASDFATASQGDKADTAVQGVKVNGTALTPDANKSVNIPLASSSANGAMSKTDKTKLDGIASGAQVNVIETIKRNGTALTPDENKAVDISVPTASSTTPKKDGTASAGSATTWAHGDHVHPTDDSREAVSNKKQSIDPTSTTEYGSSKAVAEFVNSSVATNTANFLGTIEESSLGLDYTATNAQIALALNVHSWENSPTNNDYCFVSVNDPQTTDVDEYRRFKFNGSVWAYEYTLNNSSFTQAQWDAINSGLTSSDRTAYNAAVTLLNTHVGDSSIHVTAADKTNWNSHVADTRNPHNVTKSQVGLGNVDNTSDADKPISTAQQTALNAKQNTVSTDTDSSAFGDNTTIATGFGSNKVHLNIASRLWTYIQSKISSVLGLTVNSYGGKASTAGTADYANSVAWSNVSDKPTVDQKYSATSTNAQSGTAVAQAVANKLNYNSTSQSSGIFPLLTDDSGTGKFNSDIWVDLQKAVINAISMGLRVTRIGQTAVDLNDLSIGSELGNTVSCFQIYEWWGSDKSNVTNKPYDEGSTIIVWGYTDRECCQLVLPNNNGPTYYRHRGQGTWSAWVNIRDASWINSGTFGTDRIADDAITAAKVKDNETLPVNVKGTAGAVSAPSPEMAGSKTGYMLLASIQFPSNDAAYAGVSGEFFVRLANATSGSGTLSVSFAEYGASEIKGKACVNFLRDYGTPSDYVKFGAVRKSSTSFEIWGWRNGYSFLWANISAPAGSSITFPSVETVQADAPTGWTEIPYGFNVSKTIVGAVGNSTTPVYVDSNGAVKECSSSIPTVDQTYSASSTNPQSGTAVAQALEPVNLGLSMSVPWCRIARGTVRTWNSTAFVGKMFMRGYANTTSVSTYLGRLIFSIFRQNDSESYPTHRRLLVDFPLNLSLAGFSACVLHDGAGYYELWVKNTTNESGFRISKEYTYNFSFDSADFERKSTTDFETYVTNSGYTKQNYTYFGPHITQVGTAVGSSTLPVYVDTDGSVKECSAELPSSYGTSGQYLKSMGANAAPVWDNPSNLSVGYASNAGAAESAAQVFATGTQKAVVAVSVYGISHTNGSKSTIINGGQVTTDTMSAETAVNSDGFWAKTSVLVYGGNTPGDPDGNYVLTSPTGVQCFGAASFTGNLSGNASTASGVKDYNDSSKTIEIGYAGDPLTSATYLAAYAVVGGHYYIKDISPSNVTVGRATADGLGNNIVNTYQPRTYYGYVNKDFLNIAVGGGEEKSIGDRNPNASGAGIAWPSLPNVPTIFEVTCDVFYIAPAGNSAVAVILKCGSAYNGGTVLDSVRIDYYSAESVSVVKRVRLTRGLSDISNLGHLFLGILNGTSSNITFAVQNIKIMAIPNYADFQNI